MSNKQLSDISQALGFDKFLITSKTEVGGWGRGWGRGWGLLIVISCFFFLFVVVQKIEMSTKIMADLVESFPRCSLSRPGY